MIDLNCLDHFCESYSDAVSLALELKALGKFDLFRGQRKNFDIVPTILRDGVDQEYAREQLEDFAVWVHGTPELESLHNNFNAILAVAQHYGMKTPLLDFTYNPEVAGFFASSNGEIGDFGSIICLNREEFTKSWLEINKKSVSDLGIGLAEIVEIDVKNLWRLQAQEGAFLRCHVDHEFLEMHSSMLHISFPQTGEKSNIIEEKIYPKEKSHLEVLLDHYFLIDSYSDRFERMQELFGNVINLQDEGLVEKEIASFFIDGIIPEPHKSWKMESIEQWLIEPDERLDSFITKEINLKIPLNYSKTKLEPLIYSFVLKTLERFNRNKYLIEWKARSQKDELLFLDGDGIHFKKDEFTEFEISEMINSIYFGMRSLPYTNSHIATTISRYINMVVHGVYEVMKKPFGIEFEGGNIRGRGFCEESKIPEAIRDDIYTLINPQRLNDSNKLHIRDLVFVSSNVKSCYVFDNFVEIFVSDILPSVAVVAIEGLTINFNPAKINVFGES